MSKPSFRSAEERDLEQEKRRAKRFADRLASPVSRQEMLEALERAQQRHASCGTHDCNLIADAFEALRDELLRKQAAMRDG